MIQMWDEMFSEQNPKIKEALNNNGNLAFELMNQELDKVWNEVYRVLKEEGPDHEKVFVVGVYLDKEKVAEGSGGSKQEAQVEAAEKALKIKQWKGIKTQILERKANDPIG